jgi:hypothetical protein
VRKKPYSEIQIREKHPEIQDPWETSNNSSNTPDSRPTVYLRPPAEFHKLFSRRHPCEASLKAQSAKHKAFKLLHCQSFYLVSMRSVYCFALSFMLYALSLV